MILNCPQCNARFLVADSLIPQAGRTVRCGACTHAWHVMNPAGGTADFKQLLEEEIPAPRTEPLPRANVPAIAKKKIPLKPFKIAVPVLAAVWAILAFITYFPHWVNAPAIGAIYSVLGITTTQGLAFSDVKMEREDKDGKVRFILSGNIINHSEAVRTVPMAHVSLNDKEGKSIWTRAYPVKVTLKAGEAYPFRITNVETRFAEKVVSITLDLGNSLELTMR